MLNRTLFLLTTILGLWILAQGRHSLADDQRPNVLFILADDLGWSDTTLYGTTSYYQTPNVKRLAGQGVTFMRAYSASPLCSPTRASILTGLHPARIGLTSPSCHLPKVILKAKQGTRAGNTPSFPNTSVTRLDTSYYTLGEYFKEAGYSTGHFGKWHLGHEPYSPLQHGFDVDVPHWPGPGPAGSYVAPWKFPDFDPDTPQQHLEDRMAEEATEFIRKNKDKPFFLNYWMFSVHAPFDAKADLISKYKRRLNPKGKQRSPTYAAMVESMDDAVGKLLDALEENGLTRKTIVVFFSDNGGNMYNLVDGVPATNNYPLRGGKATMFEGGVRVPCIVSYPGKVPEAKTSNRLIQSTDLFPTLAELIQRKVTQEIKFDGQSFADELLSPGASDSEDRSIFTYFPHQPRVPEWIPPSVSIHQGNHKMIRIFYGGRNGDHRHLLFDLSKDPSESNNLANRQKALVEAMGAKIDDFLEKANVVVPARNPTFEFARYDLAAEGKSLPRRTGKQRQNKSSGKSGTRKPLPKLAGWRPSAQCELSLSKSGLKVRSLGNDPHLSFDLAKELPAGTFEFSVTMTSSGGGQGQFFWQEEGVDPKFNRARSQLFSIIHDSKPHTYRVKFASPNPIRALRIDPGQKQGLINITAMSLDGESIKPLNLLAITKDTKRASQSNK